MTRKDFIAIAGAVNDARGALYGPSDDQAATIDRVLNSLARELAKVLASTNPRFDRTRFLAACGVK